MQSVHIYTAVPGIYIIIVIIHAYMYRLSVDTHLTVFDTLRDYIDRYKCTVHDELLGKP